MTGPGKRRVMHCSGFIVPGTYLTFGERNSSIAALKEGVDQPATALHVRKQPRSLALLIEDLKLFLFSKFYHLPYHIVVILRKNTLHYIALHKKISNMA